MEYVELFPFCDRDEGFYSLFVRKKYINVDCCRC